MAVEYSTKNEVFPTEFLEKLPAANLEGVSLKTAVEGYDMTYMQGCIENVKRLNEFSTLKTSCETMLTVLRLIAEGNLGNAAMRNLAATTLAEIEIQEERQVVMGLLIQINQNEFRRLCENLLQRAGESLTEQERTAVHSFLDVTEDHVELAQIEMLRSGNDEVVEFDWNDFQQLSQGAAVTEAY